MVNKAISDGEATARLYHCNGEPVSFSLVPSSDEDFEEVETTTVDRLVEECDLERVDAIKLDVEGVELLALRGACETIRSFKPTIIFELSSPAARRSNAADMAVPALLASYGYRLYRYRARPIPRADFMSPNIVAVHPDRGEIMSPFLEFDGLDWIGTPSNRIHNRTTPRGRGFRSARGQVENEEVETQK
jgi:hypothetical protein